MPYRKLNYQAAILLGTAACVPFHQLVSAGEVLPDEPAMIRVVKTIPAALVTVSGMASFGHPLVSG
jgi:hypothetical protein